MTKFYRSVAALACASIATVTLAACGDDVPQVTDDEILSMIGEGNSFVATDAPKTIPKQVDECARLLSGIDEAIYKDMPPEMLGGFKTECRKNFSEIVADKSRNTAGFVLSQRISKIAIDAQIKAREFAESAREKRKTDDRNAQTKKIDDAKQHIAGLISTFDQKFARIDELCGQWDQEYAAAKQRREYGVTRRRPDACSEEFKRDVRIDADKMAADLSKLKIDPDSLFGVTIPYSKLNDPTFFDDTIADIGQKVAGLKDIGANP